MNFLGFDINKRRKPSAPLSKDDPAVKEEPLSVSANGGLLRPATPTGTRFNRKVVMMLAAAIALIAFFAFISALRPAKQLTPQEEAAQKEQKEDKKVTLQQTPDVIQSVPGSYGEVPKFEAQKRLKAKKGQGGELGEPVPAVIGQIKNAAGGSASKPDQIGSVRDVSNDAIASYNGRQLNFAQQISAEEKELVDARKSPIKFSAIQASAAAQSGSAGTGSSNGTRGVVHAGGDFGMTEGLASLGLANDGSLHGAGGKDDDQNLQSEKRKFVTDGKKSKDRDFYVKQALQKPISPYELKAGSIIPGVMITGINSDLPGGIVGQVRENVYDTVTGRHLLIPQGTRIIGEYDSKVAYAQERVLIVWTRIIYPNGDSIDLEGMGGVDLQGYSGLSDQVNNHYMKLLGGVILSTMLSTSAKITAGNNAVGQADIGQLAAAGAGEEINKAGSKLVEKNLNVQPTLEIRPGFKFNVFVSKDLILKPYKS